MNKDISRRNLLKKMGLTAGGMAMGTAPVLASNGLEIKRNPYIYSFRIGELEAWSISDGFMLFDAGLDLMEPTSSHSQMREAMLSNHEDPSFLPMYINILVIRKGKEVIIFDAGYGIVNNAERGWFQEGLSAIGIDKNDVTTGFLSHAHGDHIDGFVGPEDKPMFPNAAIFTTQEEFNFWRQKNPDFSKSNRNPSWIPGMVKHAKKQFEILAPQIQTVKTGSVLFDNLVTVENGFGHTPGHAVYKITSGDDSLLHIVDLSHNPVLMFENPAWSVKLDHSLAVAIASRERIFSMAAEKRMRCFGFHIPWPGLGYINKKGKGYSWLPERMWW